jgi:Arc/MetJ-type ribon-helix-helix transcriptional regulator
MAITLDPVTEQRIQRQIDCGAFAEPSELLAHALDLVEAEEVYEDWLLQNKEAIRAGLKESFAEAARGEGCSLEEFETMVSERCTDRAA